MSEAVSIWTRKGFVADAWARADDQAAQETDAPLILSLDAYLSLDATARLQRKAHLAVELQPGEALNALLPHLAALPLIVLAFPAYTDGRSYSKAQILRERHGYAGDIRASGDVLFDQIAHMLRVGFSSLEIKHGPTRERLQNGLTGGVAHHYQPAAMSATKAGAYSWRGISV